MNDRLAASAAELLDKILKRMHAAGITRAEIISLLHGAESVVTTSKDYDDPDAAS